MKKEEDLKKRKQEECLLWHNRVGSVSGAPGRRLDPQPGTVG
nr:hypothetical protein [Staphylococcus aureus]